MRWKGLRAFVGRRFAPGEYLGLHLTLGLVMSLVLLGLFLLLTRSIHHEHGRLAQFDDRLAKEFQQHAADHPGVLEFFRVITHAGDVPAMAALALVGSLVLLVRRHRLAAAVWLFAALGGGILDTTLKQEIKRPRPPPEYRDATVTLNNPSYPSGHSMGSAVGYGMLAYFLVLRLRQRWARAAVVTGLGVLVLLVGFSRIYLRAHYLSDVVGGYCIGAVWLAVCISGLESLRRRKGRPGPKGPVAEAKPATD
jgi:undecaprenyl-diphosphatase